MNPVAVPHRHHQRAHSILFAVTLVTAFVLALVFVFADTAGAATRPGRGAMIGAGRHGMGMLPGLGLGILDAAEKLNLKDDQVARLKEIRKSAPGLLMPKAQALMEARIAMQDLMREQNTTSEALRQANQRVLEARSAMQAATFELRLQVREVLTPKQRTELKSLLQERRPGRGTGARRFGFGMHPWPDSGDFETEEEL